MMAQGYPGVAAQSERQEPGGRRRRHAGDAGDGQGAEGRRHPSDRSEHPRRREVHPVHDRPVLRQRADGRLNKGLFAFASYNCGPGRLRAAPPRSRSGKGSNPNVWFNNVERIAREAIGRETVQYVSNIYKYYVAYRLTVEEWTQKGRRPVRCRAPKQ